MSDMNCTHKKSGDTINGNWVCSQCFQKLQERPSVLSMERTVFRGSPDGEVLPRAKVWPRLRQKVEYVPISVCDGVSLSQFIRAMALRFVSRTRGAMNVIDATDYAILLMQDFDEEFGSRGSAWDEGGAFEIADEDLQHWDSDAGGSNS